MTAQPLLSRFQIVERPLALPGKCASCGSTDRPCVDFGCDIEDYGVVYFCLTCLTEIAQVIGLVPEQRVRDAELEAGQSVTDWLNARDLKVITNEQLAVLTDGVTRLSTALVPVVFDRVHHGDESGGTNDGAAGSEAPADDEKPADSPQQDSKPRGRGRPAGIPSDSSNGKPLDLGI